MKNVLMILAVAFASVAAVSAQDRAAGTTTKNGVAILPAAGDFALGVDAAPFLKYVGGFLSNAGATTPTFAGIDDPLSITGQYFLTESTSVRAKLGLGLISESTKTLVQDATSTDPDKKVTNVHKQGETGISLSVDYLFHRGYGRLQGYYGGGVRIGYESTTDTWKYGNEITSTYNPGARNLKNAQGSTFSFGLGGIAGVEYFVAPKISIGAEVNLGLGLSNAPKGKIVTEAWDGSKVQETTTEAYTDSGKSFFSVVPQTGLFLNFYF
ncbi:MAG: hypothetical protein LBS25_06260 [Candidatus Symbiothrix sp.]|jgi:hypothetical protein|nr:hypothetical protein [Candidatus Symbiothrix sp.]